MGLEEREKWFLEKRRVRTWGFYCLCYLWLMRTSHVSLGLLIEFTLSLLTLNEQRPRVHECALSSLFKFAQQCFLAFFLDIPVLIIIVMEFGIGPQFVWYMGPICGTCYQSHREVHRRVGFTSLLIITPPICGHCDQPDRELNRQMECVIPE